MIIPDEVNTPEEMLEYLFTINKMDENMQQVFVDTIRKVYFDKANLGMAKTSELIYELSARCDTGSIDKGVNYRTIDND